MGSDRYCLRWNNHQNNLLGVFNQLLQEEILVDVTLACSEGHSIRAHKVVLSACSSYFQSLFLDHPNRHPIIILKDVCFTELRTLVEFMYRGEVNLDYCQLPTFLKTAKSLQVKGLTEMTHLRSSLSPDRDMLQTADRQTPRDELPSTVIATTASAATAHEPLPLIRRRSRSPTDTDTSEKIPAEVVSQTQQLSPKAPRSASPVRSPGTAAGFDGSQQHSPRLPMSVSPHPPDTSSVCDDQRSMTPDPDDEISSNHSGPSDMTIGSQIPSPPHCIKAVPGPSNFLPVQSVPLSLKKESNNTDWENSEEKSSGGNSGSDFSIGRHLDSSLSSLESLYRLPPPHNFLMPPATSATSSPTSLELSSSRSSTPFIFPPFHTIPVLPPPFLPSEAPMALQFLFQHQNLIASATGAYSSPNDLSQRSFIKCAICLAGFPNGWLLEQHTLLQHSGESIRRQSSADSSLSSSSSSKEEKPFQCDQCGQSYRYRSAYIKHREQNHRARLPADKLFTCDICGMQFRYLKSFKKHRLNHTLEMLQPTTGGTIVSSRKEPKQSATHTDTRNTEAGEQPTVVSESQVSSSNEVEPQSTASTTAVKEEPADSLALALTANEPTLFNLLRYPSERQRERQLFACSFCSKTVRSKENLKLHVRKHTGERPFACLFCGRAFGGKSDLTRHVRIHTGERPYSCEMCGKCFARADYLSKHLTTHLHNSHNTRATTTSD